MTIVRKDILDYVLNPGSNLHNIQFSHDINKIDQRHTTNQRRILSKRQLQDANVFNDMHYATFYGADFSNVNVTSCLIRAVVMGLQILSPKEPLCLEWRN